LREWRDQKRQGIGERIDRELRGGGGHIHLLQPVLGNCVWGWP
jgi:hypothetical protein